MAENPATCEHCGKPEPFTPLCAECEQLVCLDCARVSCVCSRKKPYSKPRLKRYGSLCDVTMSVGRNSMNRDNARAGKADLFTA